jgi:hypothetical protein
LLVELVELMEMEVEVSQCCHFIPDVVLDLCLWLRGRPPWA